MSDFNKIRRAQNDKGPQTEETQIEDAMIDIHTHILPGFDDGPVFVEESLDMLKQAEQDGIAKIIATPHSAFLVNKKYDREEIEAAVADLRRESEQAHIQVEVIPGIEIHLTADIEQELALGKAFALAGSHYLLLELPFFSYPVSAEQIVAKLRLRGWRPILAHPERLEYFQNEPNLLRRLIKFGALVQLTAGSLLGGFGPKSQTASQVLLEHGWVHFMASDAHDSYHRTPQLAKARETAATLIGKDTARALVIDHPRAILDDSEIVIEEPARYKPRRFPFR